jgi:HEAT repeats
MTDRPPVAELIADLAARLGVARFVVVCTDLLGGAERESYVEELRALTGHDWQPGDGVFDHDVWSDYWVRTWGARGLLHVWDDGATDAIVAGLADRHWRPAEMCLKVAARHEVAGTGDGAVALADHDLPRVRAQAMRALAVTGDTEHVAAVREHLDDEDEAVRRQAARALAALERRLDLVI